MFESPTTSILQSYFRHKRLRLHNYSYDKAVILGCGPSLETIIGTPGLDSLLNESLVIAIKQSALSVPSELVDVQIYNEVRFKSSFLLDNTLKLSCSRFLPDYQSHIHYPIKSYSFDDALIRHNNYSKWELTKSFVRPWGVGIFFELGIFLPVFFGIKDIITIGLDMNRTGRFHYYDKDLSSCDYSIDEREFFYSAGSCYYLMHWLNGLNARIYNLSPQSELPLPKFTCLDHVEHLLKSR